ISAYGLVYDDTADPGLATRPLHDALPIYVVVVHRRRGGGPAVGDGDVIAVDRGQPQHQVGEGEVGDHLPIPHQQVQPFGVDRIGGSVTLEQVTHSGHTHLLECFYALQRLNGVP